MEGIEFSRDDEGNILTTLAGVFYFLTSDQVPVGSDVYLIQEVGDQDDLYYCFTKAEPMADWTVTDEMFSAAFLIDTEGVFKEEQPEQPQFDLIHYEEALARMSKNETVYRYDGKEMVPCTCESTALTIREMVFEDWFVCSADKGVKRAFEPELQQEKLSRQSPATLQDRLEQFMAANEEEVLKQGSTDKRTRFLAAIDQFLDAYEDYTLPDFNLSELMSSGIYIDYLGLDDDDLDDEEGTYGFY